MPVICDTAFMFLTSGFLTDQPVCGGRAGIRFESSHLRPLQGGTEARVAGLSRQPAHTRVGEGWRILPAPVGHVDLPQADPRRQRLEWVWRTQDHGGREARIWTNSQENQSFGLVTVKAAILPNINGVFFATKSISGFWYQHYFRWKNKPCNQQRSFEMKPGEIGYSWTNGR